MILPYLARLVCLALACFFAIHLALGLVAGSLAPSIVQLAKRLRPSSGARLLLIARLFPCMAAALVVGGICVPSYLWLEPEASLEEVGMICLAAALLAVAIWSISISRGLRALALSFRYGRHLKQAGRVIRLPQEATSPAILIDGAGGLLALAGILHPTLVISREVLQELSAGQLAAALRHERAHRTSRDNLKRLLLLLAPDILPFRLWMPNGMEALARGWARCTEWAADDRAAGGDSHDSIALAGALVRVARLGAVQPVSPLMTSLVADGCDLEARVDRLLSFAPDGGTPQSRARAGWVSAALLLAVTPVAIWMGPATLQGAHRMLEILMR